MFPPNTSQRTKWSSSIMECSSASVSPSLPLEAECCLCPNPAPEHQTFRGSKGKFCQSCLTIVQNQLTNKELSNLKLRALRLKKRARGLCARYRCTAAPVAGKTYCVSCSQYQNKAVSKHRVKKAAEGKCSFSSSAAHPSWKDGQASRGPVEYRRITIASLLCDWVPE